MLMLGMTSTGTTSKQRISPLSAWSRLGQVSCVHRPAMLWNSCSDVFIDDLQYLLVICTPTKISVLGLGTGPNSSISLFSTNLSASSPTPMDSVVGSTAGRIFMRGRDTNVYELLYSNSSSFMSSGGPSLSVSNRSSSWLMGYMFLKQCELCASCLRLERPLTHSCWRVGHRRRQRATRPVYFGCFE